MNPAQELTILGWIFLVGSWSAITVAVCYCFYRVLKSPRSPDEED
ncbi:MAG: hypothetical protein ACE5OP_05155 [Candidatus Glassbacteria bacterium]